MELKLGPITRVQRKKLKTFEDNGMVAYLEEALKSKLERTNQENRSEEKMTKSLTSTTLLPMVAPGLTVACRLLDGEAVELTPYCGSVKATKSSIEVLHQRGDLRKVLNQIYIQLKIHIEVVSEKPPIKGLVRQFQSVARDIEELKKGKSSAIMEKRVGDVQNSHPFHEGGY
ncbi:hypothetical protein M9H77_07226 [Catharanthus roseus]|uniref:Uncharacterized protein n=1 Tax=Catharanthus roseus TaxID=4058 RepID=A0ACC0BUD1_CATRO|nr:hypothetical protein M9H77_07226 [Catharanthus roseus]